MGDLVLLYWIHLSIPRELVGVLELDSQERTSVLRIRILDPSQSASVLLQVRSCPTGFLVLDQRIIGVAHIGMPLEEDGLVTWTFAIRKCADSLS